MTSTTPEHEISTETAEMTDAEAIETLVRTDEVHLADEAGFTEQDAARLADLEAAFEQAGGRGVDMAEEIDALRSKRDAGMSDEGDPNNMAGKRLLPIQGTNPRMFYVQSQIDDGVFVAWDFCRRCGKTISECTDKQGPEEPHYVTKWRKEYLAKRDKEGEKVLARTFDSMVEGITAAVIERVGAVQTPVATTVADTTDSEEEQPNEH